jgi:hypothetical protein
VQFKTPSSPAASAPHNFLPAANLPDMDFFSSHPSE